MKYPDAGINPAKSGLTARAGLYFKAGLHDKGDGFNLQDLDPYLLFDAETSMLGNLENPTLDLDPATPDTLDVITATRAGIATFTAADGQIVVADPNTVRVDHVQGEELTPTVYQRIGYTDFSSVWSPYTYGGASLTVTSGYASPDGANNAHKFDLIVGTGGALFTQNAKILNAQAYTMSVWLKGEIGGEKVRVDLKNTGSLGITGGSFILTTDWVRYTVTVTSDATDRGFQFRLTSSDGINDQVFYAYGPQLEEGTTATDFVPNTIGSPAFIASATYADRVPMLLIEPSATNLMPYSEDFENLAWYKSGLDLSYGELSPAGDNTATKLTATDSDPYLFIYVNTTAETHTFSFYCKGEGDSIGKTARVLFWYTSTATGPTESFEFTLTDQWQRHEFQTTPTGAGQVAYRIDIPANNSQAGDVAYLWGAQIELGSVATSYIPNNTGSSSTGVRNADNLVIDGTAFSDFYNATEGTFYVESEYDYMASSSLEEDQYIFDASDNIGNNRLLIYGNSAFTTLSMYIKSGGAAGSGVTSARTINTGELFRTALTYRDNSQELFTNGDNGVSLTYTPTPSVTSVSIGSRFNFSGHMKGRIKRLLYWPTHSSSL